MTTNDSKKEIAKEIANELKNAAAKMYAALQVVTCSQDTCTIDPQARKQCDAAMNDYRAGAERALEARSDTVLELTKVFRTFAKANYEKSMGWSVFTECFDDSDIVQFCEDCHDEDDVLKLMTDYAEVQDDRYADARNNQF